MKSKIYIALILIIAAVMFTSAALAELPSIKYMNRWPEPSPNTITKAGNYIYYGDGEMISVYHAENLDLKARVSIPLSGDATGAVDLEEGGVSGTEGIAGVVVQENYLYVACGSEGLRIFDVTEPEELGPEKLISYYILRKEGKRAFVKDVAVSGDTAYLAYYFFTAEGFDSGLQVLDVSNIKTNKPLKTGEIQLATLLPFELKKALRVVVHGDYAYMVDLYNGLAVFDVSNPEEDPQIAGSYYAGSIFDVAVYDNHAYLAGAQNGLIIVDVNEDNFEKGKNTYLDRVAASVYGDTLTKATAVRVSNGYAYVGDVDLGLVIIDVSSPAEVDAGSVVGWYPYYVSEEVNAETGLAGVYQLYVDEENDVVYAGDSLIGLQKIDVSGVDLIEEPYTPPSFIASASTPADSDGLFIDVETSYVYMLDDDPTINGFEEGLRILFAIESEEGISFLLKGMLPTDGEAQDIYVDGDYVYVADGSGGLKIIDPGLPQDADGNRATEQPVSPVLVGSCPIDGDAVGVHVKDGYAYVAAKAGGLKIINVSTPSAPLIEGKIGDPFVTDARAVEVAGDFAYVADGGEGLEFSEPGYLRVIDVSDKANPVWVGEFALEDSDDYHDIPGQARDLALVGDLVYVAAGNEGIQVIKVTDPGNPVSDNLVKFDQYNKDPFKDYNTAIYAVRSDDLDLIWLANGLSGVSMGFFSRPQTVPVQHITSYRSAGNTKDVFAVGDYAYIADGAGGLQALAVDEGEAEFGDWYHDPVVLPKKQYGDSNTCFIRAASGCPALR